VLGLPRQAQFVVAIEALVIFASFAVAIYYLLNAIGF